MMQKDFDRRADLELTGLESHRSAEHPFSRDVRRTYTEW